MQWARFTVTGDVAGDKAWMLFTQCLRTKTQPLGRTGREILNKHISHCEQIAQSCLAFLTAQVQ